MGFDPAPRAPLDLPAYYRNAKDQSIGVYYYSTLGFGLHDQSARRTPTTTASSAVSVALCF